MNTAEKEAIKSLKEGIGSMHWIKPAKKTGFWLYIDSWNGKLFEFIEEENNEYRLKELEVQAVGE